MCNLVGRFLVYKKGTFLCVIDVLEHACPSWLDIAKLVQNLYCVKVDNYNLYSMFLIGEDDVDNTIDWMIIDDWFDDWQLC